MKKISAILLAVLMVLSLFACTSTNAKPSEKVATSAQASTAPSAPASPSTAPASTAPSASAPASAPASAAASASAPASAAPSGGGSKITAETVGFFTDGVAPSSRKAYNIVFEYPIPMAVMDNMAKAMQQYSKKLNFNLTAQCSNVDLDKYIQDLQTSVTKGIDGFIVMPDPTISVRIKEVLAESKKPYVTMLETMRDEKGALLAPGVSLDNKVTGALMVQWLYENYKKYWGDIDTSKLGLINFTFSASVELNQRYDAALAKFTELFPNNKNTFKGDGIVTGGFDAQTGFDLASPVYSAHPEIKYWFVTSALEQYSQGAARAAESLGIGKNVLVIDVGSDVLPNEWDNNYNGSWIACIGVSSYQYSAPAICGLITLLDG